MSPLLPVALQGRFVRLEPVSLAHLPGLLEAATLDRATFGLTGVPADEAEMRAYIQEALAQHAAGEALPFATIDLRRGQPRIVGSTRLAHAERWSWPYGYSADRPAGIDAIEIGWTWLAPEAQRTPVNTEAKLLMLTHAFEAFRVLRVTLKTDARNTRSRAAIERIGGKFEGILRAHRPALTGVAGEIRHTAMFSIVREEWPSVKERLQALLEPVH